jgi:hypothetical protein
MKITAEQYAELKVAVNNIADAYNLLKRPDTSTAVLWAIFHEVNAQKSFDDTHPRWQTRARVIPLTHKDQSYIGVLYKSGLNDKTLETALKAIAKEWERKVETV